MKQKGIFAIIFDDEGMPVCKRMSQDKAVKKNLPVIQCCQCKEPATQVDGYWPYFSGKNLCDKHEYDPEIDG